MKLFFIDCPNCQSRLSIFPPWRDWWRHFRRCDHCQAVFNPGMTYGALWISINLIPWIASFLWIVCNSNLLFLLLLSLILWAIVSGFYLQVGGGRMYRPWVFDDARVKLVEAVACLSILVIPAVTTCLWIALAVAMVVNTGAGATIETLRTASKAVDVAEVLLAVTALAIPWLLLLLILFAFVVWWTERSPKWGVGPGSAEPPSGLSKGIDV